MLEDYNHKIKQKTGTMDQSWRGEIEKYPPNPERFVNTASLWSKGKPKEEGGGCQTLKDEVDIFQSNHTMTVPNWVGGLSKSSKFSLCSH